MRITGLEHLIDFNRILRAAVKRGPVLVCYLDGLGWYGYGEAVKRQAMPFVREHFFMNPMQTVFPPLTNPAMATMLTGVLPDVHGVVSRKQHRMQVPSIFAEVSEGIVVEGDSVIVQTEVPQRLHTEAENGNLDHSVFADGLALISKEPPLLLLHFHGIDDAAHTYGPYAPETMDKIKEMDSYLEQLSAVWTGTLLLISDHGLHEIPGETEDTLSGDHGEDSKEDRTIIFGWHDKRIQDFPARIVVKDLMEMLAPDQEIRQIVFTGTDGYASACGKKELEGASGAQLYFTKGASVQEDCCRLMFPGEPIARRCCKDIEEISIQGD